MRYDHLNREELRGAGMTRVRIEHLTAAGRHIPLESSKIEQKRQLIGFLFSNLQLRGGKLEFSLRNPFHLMVGTRSHSEWLGLLDICSQARQIFTGSTDSEKRAILNFVFANLTLKATTLCFDYKKPFDMLVSQADCKRWLRMLDTIGNDNYLLIAKMRPVLESLHAELYAA